MTPETEQQRIEAAHPLRTGRHDLYAEAARLVGERHAKYDLVDLVNWLLSREAWQIGDPPSPGDYLATWGDDGERSVDVLFYTKYKQWFRYAGGSPGGPVTVLAWRPLPEPHDPERTTP